MTHIAIPEQFDGVGRAVRPEACPVMVDGTHPGLRLHQGVRARSRLVPVVHRFPSYLRVRRRMGVFPRSLIGLVLLSS